MKKTVTGFAFAIAILGMGISMPSCPGQQAMEQRIDTLEKSNAEMKRIVLGSDGTMKAMAADVATLKGQLGQMSQDIATANAHMAALDTSMAEVKAKMAAPPPKGKPAAKKRR